MAELDNLMFKREHFPLSGNPTYGLDDIVIPPYHPSMIDLGIEPLIVESVIEPSIKQTILDLKEAERITQRLYMDTGKLQIPEKDRYQALGGISFRHFPIVEFLDIEKYEMKTPYGTMEINPDVAPDGFLVPDKVAFSPELMREYGMTDGYALDYNNTKRIYCPNMWHTHNCTETARIFFKNFVIAYDNKIVERAYGRNRPK